MVAVPLDPSASSPDQADAEQRPPTPRTCARRLQTRTPPLPQVHILELPNPDPDTAEARPAAELDRNTAYSVKSLAPVAAALEANRVPFSRGESGAGAAALYCRDPDANVLMFVEDESIQPLVEAYDGPMVPWTRLW